MGIPETRGMLCHSTEMPVFRKMAKAFAVPTHNGVFHLEWCRERKMARGIHMNNLRSKAFSLESRLRVIHRMTPFI